MRLRGGKARDGTGNRGRWKGKAEGLPYGVTYSRIGRKEGKETGGQDGDKDDETKYIYKGKYKVSWGNIRTRMTGLSRSEVESGRRDGAK